MLIVMPTNVGAKNWIMDPDAIVVFDDDGVDATMPQYDDFTHTRATDGNTLTVTIPVQIDISGISGSVDIAYVALIIYYYWNNGEQVWDDTGGDETPFENPSWSEEDASSGLGPGDLVGDTSVSVDVTNLPPMAPGNPPAHKIRFYANIYGIGDYDPHEDDLSEVEFFVTVA